MSLFKHLPRFIRLQLLNLIEEQVNHLSDAEIAKGLDYVKAFILAQAAAFLRL